MNIVILGAGSKGLYLSKILAQEEHNVFIIDKDSSSLKKVSEEADVATIHGIGSHWKILDSLIENNPSLFIALTGDDETNLVSSSIAKNLGYPQTISRVKNIEFLSKSRLDFSRLFFVDHFIGVEVLTAHDILKHVINLEDLAIENFAHGAIQMRTLKLPKNWDRANIEIHKLDLPKELIIALIRRKVEDREEIIFPKGADVLLPYDEITIIGETKIMYNLHTVFHFAHDEIHSVVIFGGSSVALNLAKILEKMNVKTKIIEKDEHKCINLAEALPRTTIINHDAMDINFMENESIKASNIAVSCTADDKTNILLSLLAKQIGTKNTLSLISDISLSPVLRDLDIRYTLSEKVNIANKVLSIIHAKKILSIASLCENQAKVLEIKVSKESKVIGIPLSDLRQQLPKNLLIAAIENKGKVMIGKGDRVISPNDSVIIICSPEHIHELEALF